ncbi:MAG: O-antigen ligase family protein [Pirellulales bacterium]|nr:O-antigen ligase family protein [Pirellulales bacterium]
MPVVAVLLALAAVVWGMVLARRGSLLVGCGLLIVTGYVFGHEFWNARLGPLPLTLDRALLLGLLASFAWQWRLGTLTLRPPCAADWALAAMLLVVTGSAILSGSPEMIPGVTPKWGRLVASFWIPSVAYALVRQLPVSRRDWLALLATFVMLGVYLAATGLFEVAGAWALVFPKYIANPELGIHFGRARGPELNSVGLGIYLTACAACAGMLLPQARKRWQQFVLLIALPLMTLTVLLTYTRSTWIGFAAAAAIVGWFAIPRAWRVPIFGTTAVAGLLLAAVSWSAVMGLRREGTAEEAAHSVNQRASFAYISSQMFCDHPTFGVGFGRFYDRKMPYLSDRRQTVELESIRGLHHHNTLLSIVTEMGIVGFAACAAAFIAWGRAAWQLAGKPGSPAWVRSQGVLMLAVLASYLSSAVFHDLTLLPAQELLLFMVAGLTVNLWQSAPVAINDSDLCPR